MLFRSALKVTGGSAETIHTDLIRAAFSTAACIAIAPLQDYLGLGSEARLNTPGTPGGNWRWRVLESQLSSKLCDNIALIVEASERGLSAHIFKLHLKIISYVTFISHETASDRILVFDSKTT